MKKEPFLINPPKKIKTKKILSKSEEKTIKDIFKRRDNPMSELLLLNPKKKKTSSKKKTLGKKHRLVAFGEVGNIMISPKSRLAPKSRGRILNPVIAKNDLNYVLGLSLGFAGSRIIPRLIDKNLPDNLKVGFGRIVVQTASGVGLSLIVGSLFKKRDLGKLILYGTLINTAINIIDNYIFKGMLSAEGLSTLQELPEENVVQQLPEENAVQQLPEENIVEQLPEENLVEDLSQQEEQPIIIV